MKCIYLYI